MCKNIEDRSRMSEQFFMSAFLLISFSLNVNPDEIWIISIFFICNI